MKVANAKSLTTSQKDGQTSAFITVTENAKLYKSDNEALYSSLSKRVYEYKGGYWDIDGVDLTINYYTQDGDSIYTESLTASSDGVHYVLLYNDTREGHNALDRTGYNIDGLYYEKTYVNIVTSSDVLYNNVNMYVKYAVADPDNPINILEAYTHDDGLHPYDGYDVMANAIDLSLFE